MKEHEGKNQMDDKNESAPKTLDPPMQWIWSLWGYNYAHQFTSFPPISSELREAYLAIFGIVSNLSNRRRSILPIHPAPPLFQGFEQNSFTEIRYIFHYATAN